MLVAGITGNIGSGKSALCDILVERGAVSLSADRIGHQLLRKGTGTYRRVVDRFGKGILDRAGNVDRGILGGIVFTDPEALAALNGIVHPPLLRRLRREVRKLRESGPGLGLLEAALLAEWGSDVDVDVLVYVHCPRAIRRRRWIAGTGRPGELFDRIDQSQFSSRRKAEHAHIILHNASGKDSLREKADRLWDLLSEYQRTNHSFPDTRLVL